MGEWIRSVYPSFTNDAVWKIEAYRLSLFLSDLGWNDLTRINSDKRTTHISSQLYRALSSISANISEGFSRSSHLEKARFYEYALGSARESRDWYYKTRHVLGNETVEDRFLLLDQVIRLLLKMIPDQRSYSVKEEGSVYELGTSLPE